MVGYTYTDKGSRNINEDSCALIETDDNRICAVVADGLGGHGGGSDASNTTVEVIKRLFMEDEEHEPSRLAAWIQIANQEVLQHQHIGFEMKSTLVLLTIKHGIAIWAHVGDSRLYHFMNGKLIEQTFDHSVSQMAVIRGEISQSEIRGHIDRNRLLRALGMDDSIRAEVSEPKDIRNSCHAFLLCTDGFWEYVTEREMEKDLKHSRSAEIWMDKMLSRHRRRTKNIDHDNNSAIAIILNNINEV